MTGIRNNQAVFANASFDSLVYFESATFYSRCYFVETFFPHAQFRASDSLILENAKIFDEFYLGPFDYNQKVNLIHTFFADGAKLVLSKPVDLVIQLEKIKHIDLTSKGSTFKTMQELLNLEWSEKWQIINDLKAKSFKDQKSAHLELDYIFAKATMFQDFTGEESRWHEIWKWPAWSLKILYERSMGLGYRPFRLVYWILGLIVIFSIIYWRTFPLYINRYIKQDTRIIRSKFVSANDFETILNCVYFSVMVLFTFRLKRDILISFDSNQKKIIVTEWVLGFLIYVAFLTFSKSGSILHNLKDLFVG